MKVGDYVRTKQGRIGKISNLTVDYSSELVLCEESYIPFAKHQIIKSSPNIIDLIEVGDYVNGHRVSDIYENIDGQIRMKFGENGLVLAHKSNYDNYYLFEEDIKSIVTKEQFESMEYKIESEVN